VVPARPDLLGGDVDRFQARGAEPVELDAAHRVRQPRRQDRGPSEISALIADRGNHAEHKVVDALGVESGVAAAQRVNQSHDEVDRLAAMQRAGRLPAARGVRMAS